MSRKQDYSLRPLPRGWERTTRSALTRAGATVLGAIYALNKSELDKKLKEILSRGKAQAAYDEIMASCRKREIQLFDSTGTNAWPLATRVKRTFGNNLNNAPTSVLIFFEVITPTQYAALKRERAEAYGNFRALTIKNLRGIFGVGNPAKLLRHLEGVGISLRE